jgi:hypothetical protein
MPSIWANYPMHDRHGRSGSVTRHVPIGTRDVRDALTVTQRDERDANRDGTVTVNVTDPPERLERIAHRCGVITEDGTECPTWTLQAKCYRHRRQQPSR